MPRFMMLMYPNITEEQYEEGVRADDAAAMTKFNESLTQAGVLLALDGLHPPRRARASRSRAARRPSPTARSPRPRSSSAATG